MAMAMMSSTASSSESSPKYMLFHKGETSSSSMEGIHFVQGEMKNDDDEPTKTANDVSNFVSLQLQRKKIGNFIYSLSKFDLIAAMVMKTSYSNEDGAGVSAIQSYAWAYTAKILAWLQHWNTSNHLSFNAELSELYAKTSLKIYWNKERQVQYGTPNAKSVG